MTGFQQTSGGTFGDVTGEYGEQKGVHLKVEKNSRGYNWTASVYGDTVDDAMSKLNEAVDLLSRQFGAAG